MNWKPTGIALLTAMILVAGCLGGNPGTTTTRTAQTTNTAYSTTVTTATTATTATRTTVSPDEADLPPGVTADGISNVSALLSAHKSSLSKSGFRFEARSSNRRDGKTTAIMHGRATAGLSTRLVMLNKTGDPAYHSTTWRNESTTIMRVTSGNRTHYREYHYRGSAVAQSNTIRSMFQSGDLSIQRVEHVGNQTVTILHGDRYSGTRLENVSDYSATLAVDSTGRVHEFHWHFVTDEQTRTVDFDLTATHSDAIERPDWVDKAERAIRADIRTSTDSGRLVISNRGGDVLPPGSKLELVHDGTTYTATFDHSLKSGEKAYFYFPNDGGDPILATTDPGKDAGVQFDGSYSLVILSPDSVVVSSSGFAVGHTSSSAS